MSMATRIRFSGKAIAASVTLGLGASLLPAPAAAQDEARLRRLESEIRALQRAVFPGADGRYFEPEIATGQQQPAEPVGTPSETALTDVLARLSAIESQLAQLTAASEVNANALQQLETRVDRLDSGGAAAPSGAIPVPGGRGRAPSPSAGDTELPALSGGSGAAAPASSRLSPPASSGAVSAAASGPSAERLAAVQAIAKPSTEDAGDDEYVYGFRLWDADFYPEAQQQLALFLERYPSHWRTTYGRNLLGRAYLDAGDPRTAANYFFENYQSDNSGARAPDSLLFLAESMIELGDTSRACIALAEFGDSYPALATGRLQQQYDANRARVDCQ